jgi:hypothetical protein
VAQTDAKVIFMETGMSDSRELVEQRKEDRVMTSRKRKTTIRLVLALAFALAIGVTAVLAVHDDGVFEIDGNVTDGDSPTGTPGEDWETLFTCGDEGIENSLTCTSSGAGGASARQYIDDGLTATIFTGGGSKDDLNISQWRFKDGSVPAKDNLLEAMAAVYAVGTSTRLYFAASKFETDGSAQIGFWFFNNHVVKATGPGGTFVDENGDPATHAVRNLATGQRGDLLILANFSNGGAVTNIQALEVTAVDAQGNVSFTTLAAGNAGANLACDDSPNFNGTGTHRLCASTNAGDEPTLDPDWTPRGGTAGTYPAVSFFEGGVDLGNLGLSGACFPAFLVETRSSPSLTAQLKDFALKELQVCQATITTEILDSNGNVVPVNTEVPVNSTLHDRAIVQGEPGIAPPSMGR